MNVLAPNFHHAEIAELFTLKYTPEAYQRVQEIIGLGEAIIPDLELLINFGTENFDAILENIEEDYGNGIIHALLILGELKAHTAFSTIRTFTQMPQDGIMDLLGDVKFAVLDYALIHCGFHNLEDMLEAFEDTQRNKFERLHFSQAAIWLGKLYPENREHVIKFFRSYLTSDIHQTFEEEQKLYDSRTFKGLWFSDGDEDFPAMVCSHLAIVQYIELLPEIEQFFAEYKAFPGIIDVSTIRRCMADSSAILDIELLPERPLAETYQWIDKTFYQERPIPAFDSPALVSKGLPEGMVKLSASSSTLVRAEPKIGRNDPCPLDDKKKFKKCCGAKGHSSCQKM